jgi:hypothetical protein
MPDRPDPQLSAALCHQTLAEVWNLGRDALRSLEPGELARGDQVTGWLRARCALEGLEYPGSAGFPKAVVFPLVARDGRGEGALGLVECRYSVRMDHDKPPPDVTDAAARTLDWLGTDRRQSLSAQFHLPPGADGGSVALAVLIAGLLASEPHLLPGFGGAELGAHRFAATGSTQLDESGQLRLVRPDYMAAKMRLLRDRGYKTLFTIAPAEGCARETTPDGLEVVELPADPERCCRMLRDWFLARQSPGARLLGTLRRHAWSAAIGIAIALGAAALGLAWPASGVRPVSAAAAGPTADDAGDPGPELPVPGGAPERKVAGPYTFSGGARRDNGVHSVHVHDGVLDRITGRITFRAEVKTEDALRGFRAAVRVEFTDGEQRQLGVVESAPLGVDGKLAPWGAPSQRFVDVEAELPPQVAEAVRDHRIVVKHLPH